MSQLRRHGAAPIHERSPQDPEDPSTREVPRDPRGGAGRPDVVMVLENNSYPLDSRVRKEAESLVDSGLAVEVLAPRQPDRPNREIIRGVQVTRYPLPDGGGALLGTAIEHFVAALVVPILVVPRLFRSRHATLHVHNPPDLFFPLLWLARLRGWSTVFDHHDDAAGMLRAKLGRATLVERLLSVMRRCSTRAADLTITTNDTQRYLVQASARSVAVVRNAPPNWFADHRARSPDGRAKLVFLGEIGIQDRVILAVDILASLIGTHRLDVELLVVGDGPQRGQVERRASALGVASRVTFTGWVPYNTVPALLASAHVGIDTAPKTEVNDGSTMIKILEYLAVGLPVVATALRETLITGLDAVAAVSGDDPDDFAAPIAALISDPEAWAAASTRASERGKCLRWPAQAALLVDEYRRVRQTEMR